MLTDIVLNFGFTEHYKEARDHLKLAEKESDLELCMPRRTKKVVSELPLPPVLPLYENIETNPGPNDLLPEVGLPGLERANHDPFIDQIPGRTADKGIQTDQREDNSV